MRSHRRAPRAQLVDFEQSGRNTGDTDFSHLDVYNVKRDVFWPH